MDKMGIERNKKRIQEKDRVKIQENTTKEWQ
jgi:hypothetical protein